MKLKRVSLFLGLALGCVSALANPIEGEVVNGQATFSQPDINTFNITNTPGAIINWQQFSIQNNETTRFIQQGASSSVLNRVVSQSPSDILGNLLSNGRVFVINPNGIVFGPDSIIDTAGMVASSLNITNEDFINGNYRFEGNGGAIQNKGYITAGADGDIFLIAPNIENSGIIQTDGGDLVLAAGQSVTIASLDSDHIVFDVQAPDNAVVNLGEMITNGGAASIFAGTIRNSGSINANSISVDKNGNIQLSAKADIEITTNATISANGSTGGEIKIESNTGTVWNSGTIEAKGEEGQGGRAEVLGERVALMDEATMDVSGETGGGEILIGGDYQGRNINVKNSTSTYIGRDTKIRADAETIGDGGKVIVWADEITKFHGNISARGGDESGNGGFIETSGKDYLEASGRVDTSANNGVSGEWLLDPTNVTIDTTDVAGSLTNGIWTPSATGSIIANTTIEAALAGGTSVTITTTGVLAEAGNITVNAPIAQTVATTATLTLQADNNIDVNAGIGTSGARFNHDLLLSAGNRIGINSPIYLSDNTLSAIAPTIVLDAITDVGIGTVKLSSTGSVTQTAAITAGVLELRGVGGSHTLTHAGNQVGEVKMDTGSVVLTNNGTTTVNGTLAPGQGLETLLTSPTPVASEQLGASIDVDGDVMVVGAPGTFMSGQGAAYVYRWNGTNWVFEAKLTTPGTLNFGQAVTVEGTHIVVGAPESNTSGFRAGAAYPFEWNGTNWVAGTGLSFTGAGFESVFGWSMAIDNGRLVVGGAGNPTGTAWAGRLWFFDLVAGLWVQQGTVPNPAPSFNDFFTLTLEISGDSMIVGSSVRNGQPGEARIYEFNTGTRLWDETQQLTLGVGGDFFGSNVSISGDIATVAETPNGSAGSVHIFRDNGASWALEQIITPTDVVAGDMFGTAVQVRDGVIVATSARADLPGNADAGAGYVFEFNGASWQQDSKITASTPAVNDQFGFSAALADQRIFFGALFADPGGQLSAGAAYVFEPGDAGSTLSGSLTINSDDSVIATALEVGTTLSLQANNDIIQNVGADISFFTGGAGGDFNLQAGRNILINADITTNNGELIITANDTGAMAADRNAGAAEIIMASGTTLNAGTNNITLDISFQGDSGNMVVDNLIANDMFLRINGMGAGSSILRVGPTSLISGNSLFVDHDPFGGPGGGSVGTLAEPLRIQLNNFGAHTHLTSPGIFIDSPTQGVTVGGSFFGSFHIIQGLEAVTDGDVVLNVNGTVTTTAGPLSCGGTGGPICAAGGNITIIADDLIHNSIIDATVDVTLYPFSPFQNIEIGGAGGLNLTTTELQAINTPTLYIGDTPPGNTNPITLSTDITSADINASDLWLRGRIDITGGINFTADGENLSLEATSTIDIIGSGGISHSISLGTGDFSVIGVPDFALEAGPNPNEAFTINADVINLDVFDYTQVSTTASGAFTELSATGDLTIDAGGDIFVAGGGSNGRANILGNNSIIMSAGDITLIAGTGTAVGDADAEIINNSGTQLVDATGTLTLTGGSDYGSANIFNFSGTTQTINANDLIIEMPVAGAANLSAARIDGNIQDINVTNGIIIDNANPNAADFRTGILGFGASQDVTAAYIEIYNDSQVGAAIQQVGNGLQTINTTGQNVTGEGLHIEDNGSGTDGYAGIFCQNELGELCSGQTVTITDADYVRIISNSATSPFGASIVTSSNPAISNSVLIHGSGLNALEIGTPTGASHAGISNTAGPSLTVTVGDPGENGSITIDGGSQGGPFGGGIGSGGLGASAQTVTVQDSISITGSTAAAGSPPAAIRTSGGNQVVTVGTGGISLTAGNGTSGTHDVFISQIGAGAFTQTVSTTGTIQITGGSDFGLAQIFNNAGTTQSIIADELILDMPAAGAGNMSAAQISGNDQTLTITNGLIIDNANANAVDLATGVIGAGVMQDVTAGFIEIKNNASVGAGIAQGGAGQQIITTTGKNASGEGLLIENTSATTTNGFTGILCAGPDDGAACSGQQVTVNDADFVRIYGTKLPENADRGTGIELGGWSVNNANDQTILIQGSGTNILELGSPSTGGEAGIDSVGGSQTITVGNGGQSGSIMIRGNDSVEFVSNGIFAGDPGLVSTSQTITAQGEISIAGRSTGGNTIAGIGAVGDQSVTSVNGDIAITAGTGSIAGNHDALIGQFDPGFTQNVSAVNGRIIITGGQDYGIASIDNSAGTTQTITANGLNMTMPPIGAGNSSAAQIQGNDQAINIANGLFIGNANPNAADINTGIFGLGTMQDITAGSIDIRNDSPLVTAIQQLGPGPQIIQTTGQNGLGEGIRLENNGPVGSNGGAEIDCLNDGASNFCSSQQVTVTDAEYVRFISNSSSLNGAGIFAGNILNAPVMVIQSVLIHGSGLNSLEIGTATGAGDTYIENSHIPSQTITAGNAGENGSITIQAGMADGDFSGIDIGFASGIGTQTIAAQDSITIVGGTAPTSSEASIITYGGVQTISSGSGGINITAGANSSTGAGNIAGIYLDGGVFDQNITVNNAGNLLLTGGSGVDNNEALITSTGSQTLNVTGDIGISGGVSGFNNRALIEATTSQTITANNLFAVAGSTGNSNRARLRALGGLQDINLTGFLTVQGGVGGSDNAAFINGDLGANITAADIVVSGGSGTANEGEIDTKGAIQTINVTNSLDVRGGSSGDDNFAGIFADRGQDISTGGTIFISAGNNSIAGNGNQASIAQQGLGFDQTLTLNNGSDLILDGGNGIDNNYAVLQNLGGNIIIQKGTGAGTSDILLTGGGGANSLNNFAAIETLDATGAGVFITIDGDMLLTAGNEATAADAYAEISTNTGSITAVVGGNVSLQGGGGSNSDAGIDTDFILSLDVGGSLLIAGGSGTEAGAGLSAQTIRVDAGGDIDITGGTGSSAEVGIGADDVPVVIVLGNTAPIGGDINISGGSAAGITGIGSLCAVSPCSAAITIDTLGSLNLQSGSGTQAFIGSVTQDVGLIDINASAIDLGDGVLKTNDNVFLNASNVSGGITQSAAGIIDIGSNTLTVMTAGGDVSLLGTANVIGSLVTNIGACGSLALFNTGMSLLGNTAVCGGFSITSTNGIDITTPLTLGTGVTLDGGTGNVDISGSGSITAGGDVSLTGLDVYLNATGITDIDAAGFNVTITSTGEVTNFGATGGIPDVLASTLTVNAVNGVELDVAVDTLNVTNNTAGSVIVFNTDAAVTADIVNTGRPVLLESASGSIAVGTVDGSAVDLFAGTDITDANGTGANITATNFTYTAPDGFGTFTDPLEMQISNPFVIANSNGDIGISQTGDLALTGSTSASGNVYLSASNTLNVTDASLNGNDVQLSGSSIQVVANSGNAQVSAVNDLSIMNTGAVLVQGSNVNSGGSAKIFADNTIIINADSVTIRGGDADFAFAQIDPVSVEMTLTGDLTIEGGAGAQSGAMLAGDIVDIIAGGNVNLTGGAGDDAYAVIDAVTGDVNIESASVALQGGTGMNADAVIVANLGDGNVALTAAGCTNCEPLEMDPFTDPATQNGVFGIFANPSTDVPGNEQVIVLETFTDELNEGDEFLNAPDTGLQSNDEEEEEEILECRA